MSSFQDAALPKFSEVRKKAASNLEALDRYADIMRTHYSLERARAESMGDVSVATWITFRTEGIDIKRRHLAGLLFGIISFDERMDLHPYQTFHPCNTDGQWQRTALSGISEFAGLMCGLLGLCCGVSGVLILTSQGGFSIMTGVICLIASGACLLGSRFLLRLSKVLKIPPEITKDKTSPYRLHSFRKLAGCSA